jgi:hypothetical protein
MTGGARSCIILGSSPFGRVAGRCRLPDAAPAPQTAGCGNGLQRRRGLARTAMIRPGQIPFHHLLAPFGAGAEVLKTAARFVAERQR